MSRVRFNTMEKGRMKQQSLTTKQAGNVHVDVMHACMFQLASYLNPLCAGSCSAMEMRTALHQPPSPLRMHFSLLHAFEMRAARAHSYACMYATACPSTSGPSTSIACP